MTSGLVAAGQEREFAGGASELARMLAEGRTVPTLPEQGERWALCEDFPYVMATHRYVLGPGYSTPAERVRQVRMMLALAEREWGIRRIHARGSGSAGHILILSAALEPRMASVSVQTPMTSYRELLEGNWRARFYDVVPWLLETADLPQIAACLAPRRLEWGVTDPAPAEWTKRVYALTGAGRALAVRAGEE
ncbi:hypothetical protein HS125_10255 [bacterium]|nr:hypothetical protein [bacterium]